MSYKKIEAVFWVILLRGPRLLLGRPYYEPLLWFVIFIEESAFVLTPYWAGVTIIDCVKAKMYIYSKEGKNASDHECIIH